jgi:hypothetical protein
MLIESSKEDEEELAKPQPQSCEERKEIVENREA